MHLHLHTGPTCTCTQQRPGPPPAPVPRRALFDEYDSLCEPHHERHDQQQLGDAAADHTSTTHTTAAIANTAAIAATPDGSLHARKLALAGRVVRLLSAHASAEERSLYPLARSVLPYGKELYDKSLVDDQVGGRAGGGWGWAVGRDCGRALRRAGAG